MIKKHLKRAYAPKSWPIKRKGTKFVVRPNPGKHRFSMGMPIKIIFTDVLKYAKTRKEVIYILQNKNVTVDKKPVKDLKCLVGLMDVMEIGGSGEIYRAMIDNDARMMLLPIENQEADLKLCRINNKCFVRGKLNINLHDGRTVVVDNLTYKVGDSVLLKLPTQEIKDHLKLEVGSTVYLTGGKHTGEIGKVNSIEGEKIIVGRGREEFNTLKKFAFVVGKEKPVIKVAAS